MRDEHENAILLEVRNWLPPDWRAEGRNGGAWASIRFTDQAGVIRGRLKLHRKLPEPAVTGAVTFRRVAPHRGSFDADGPTWDLREPDSVDRMERWVRRKIFRGDFTCTRPVSPGEPPGAPAGTSDWRST